MPDIIHKVKDAISGHPENDSHDTGNTGSSSQLIQCMYLDTNASTMHRYP